MKRKIFLPMFVLLIGLLCVYTGCVLQETGTLTLNLTDDPADYCEVFVTFSEISVHKGELQDGVEEQEAEMEEEEKDGSWIIIKPEAEEDGHDLLTLQDAFTLLAKADLEPGIYTQIRLKIVDGEDDFGEPKTYVNYVRTAHKL